MNFCWPWLARPGLAGGIDKTGERAAELLRLGFGSVEFGSVQTEALPALLARLSAAHPAVNPKNAPEYQAADRLVNSATGIGLGLPAELPPARLGAEWQRGIEYIARRGAAAGVDYLSLNLSAAANRRFLEPPLRAALDSALAALAASRADLPIPLAVKLPAAAARLLGQALAAAGVDQLTVVLPEHGGLAAMAAVRGAVRGMRLVAVGGLANAADVAAVRAAGADGIQVHRLFVAHGAATPARLGGEWIS